MQSLLVVIITPLVLAVLNLATYFSTGSLGSCTMELAFHLESRKDWGGRVGGIPMQGS